MRVRVLEKRGVDRGRRRTHLKNGVLLLGFELVGTEQLETALSFSGIETLLSALKELEDIVDHDSLQIDLVLVVKVLRGELNLQRERG